MMKILKIYKTKSLLKKTKPRYRLYVHENTKLQDDMNNLALRYPKYFAKRSKMWYEGLPPPGSIPLFTIRLRVFHGSDGPAGRVGSRFCRILAGRVGSGQHFGFISFLLIISWLNRYESSNTTLLLIDFHRYLIYNSYLIYK